MMQAVTSVSAVHRESRKTDEHTHTHTFAAALHMSATILPDTHVSKMLEVAKLYTFCNATWHKQRRVTQRSCIL